MSELDPRDAFIGRHIGPDPEALATMLSALGLESLEALLDAAVPEAIRTEGGLRLPAPVPEVEALDRLREVASRNRPMISMIGQGYSDTHTPGVIARNILENPAWYTAYTPYQPEISQGRLEALLNFQTMVTELCGMDLANASLLDEGTAAAEAMTLLHRVSRSGMTFLVDADCHPQTIEVVATRAEPLGIKVVVGDPSTAGESDAFGALLASPGTSGTVRDLTAEITALHERGTLVAVVTDPLAMCVMTPPGEQGADVVVGSAQRFGVPMGFGGPHAGFMAVRSTHKRSLPGRLVGVSVDAAGRRALRLALQTREQHIRREKATSNICTAQVLLAVIASMYAVYHGPGGLRAIATRVHRLTAAARSLLIDAGVDVRNDTFFDTLTVGVSDADAVLAAAAAGGINLRRVDGSTVGISLDETTTPDVLARALAAFGVTTDAAGVVAAAEQCAGARPDGLVGLPSVRTTPFLQHDVFHTHRSETEMLRYLRRLADRDLALDRSMIPLGSCTMKLNATAEMLPITWPEFARMHPFAPADQTEGYLQMIRELEAMLVECTGYDRISLQPNAGSQGEFAGLLAIRRYHESRGEGGRTVCLIPASAHGTNAASAVMAGMSVVVVATDESGNVDLDDLDARIAEAGPRLAALMVTYPSTHGVYEESIVEICERVHMAGGQVYLDGANLNALVGVAKPGRFGADVSHLNLHKTFCIPHGGGGPGVGPVAVREHLAPFLPNHPSRQDAGPASGPGPISAAPYGSASILPIPWMYITMMGAEGLRAATATAILAANYVAHRLGDHYPVLYRGRGGFVAHECIIDIRPIEAATGVTNEDIAKRLIDYGFHAPTMSFPVPGTLMIEPTESESLDELDRFCEAMIAIRSEIDRVASGEWSPTDNPLRNAPHTVADVSADEWTHPYRRDVAAYPVERLRTDRYWPPVSRIDNGYGDRNLFCSCG